MGDVEEDRCWVSLKAEPTVFVHEWCLGREEWVFVLSS